MGEAKRRGSYEQRKAVAIENVQIKREREAQAEIERRINMTPEEKRREVYVQKKLAAVMGMLGAFGGFGQTNHLYHKSNPPPNIPRSRDY
jgi:hypothetical protein